MIGIIDYGSGNIMALRNAFKLLGIPTVVCSRAQDLQNATHLVLPGVGNFGQTMRTIKETGLALALEYEVNGKAKQFLGICVGMQCLANSSEESDEAGLGWISGTVNRISNSDRSLRLPHMGWNGLSLTTKRSPLFDDVDEKAGFYFLHNYHYNPHADDAVVASAEYGSRITAAISNGQNIHGVQFHPEKSHKNGLQLLRNFSQL